MMSNSLRPALLGLLVALLLAAPFAAFGESVETLGDDGELMVVRTGDLGEVDPGAVEEGQSIPVLLLEVHPPEGDPTLELVPSTGSIDPEFGPTTFYEHDSGRLYILWETLRNRLHSQLDLIWWDATEGWSEVIELSGSPYGEKSEPKLLVVHDEIDQQEEDGSLSEHRRTVAHVAWWESTGGGFAAYSPVVLEDGRYIGQNPVYFLPDLLATDLGIPADGGEASAELTRLVGLRRGTSSYSTIVSFADAERSRLVAVEILTYPAALLDLAEQARSHILDVGFQLYQAGRLDLLEGEARSHILDVGFQLHSRALLQIADSLAAWIRQTLLEQGDAVDLEQLGAQARSHILDVGFAFLGNFLTSGEPERWVEWNAEDGTRLVFATRRTVELSFPEIGDGTDDEHRPVWLLTRSDGQALVVAWLDGDSVLRARESLDDGSWSEARSLHLGASLSLDRALDLLAVRLEHR